MTEPTSQAVTPTEPRKCPSCGTKLIPASQAFSEIRERITAEEPPELTEAIEQIITELDACSGDSYNPPALNTDAIKRELESIRAMFAQREAGITDLCALLRDVNNESLQTEAQVASLSSQLARQQATYEAWGRAFSDEELSSMQEQNNWNQFEASLFKTCQRLSSQLERLNKDSEVGVICRWCGELQSGVEAGSSVRWVVCPRCDASEIKELSESLERLRAEQLTAEQAKHLRGGTPTSRNRQGRAPCAQTSTWRSAVSANRIPEIPMAERFQFVWWGFEGFAWWRFPWGVRHFEGGLRSIYRYSLCLGPLEIRRWENAPFRRQSDTGVHP